MEKTHVTLSKNLLTLLMLASTLHAAEVGISYSADEISSEPQKGEELIIGGPVKHSYACAFLPGEGPVRLLDEAYTLECETQALHPKHNFRGCQLYHQVSTAKPTLIPLVESKQSEDMVWFKGAVNKTIKVRVDKSSHTGFVTLGNQGKMVCTHVDK